MANSLIVAGHGAGVDVADASTKFFPISGNLASADATEANIETPVREGGVFSNLFVECSANDIASATSATVTLDLSRVATAVTVSYGTSQTGIKEDTTHTVTAVNTDEASHKVVATAVSGSHNFRVSLIGIQFAPTTSSNCDSFMVATIGASFSVASTSNYFHPQGKLDTQATEANIKWRVRASFTASHLWINVTTNARTTDTTYTSRKNGAAGNQIVTYTSTQTGQKEDTTNTDSLVAGDDYNYSITTGTGTGGITASLISSILTSTSSFFALAIANAVGTAQAFNVTTNYAVSAGGIFTTGTEAFVQIYPRFTFTAKELGAILSANTIATSATTVFLRVTGANGNSTLSYAAGQTGLKNDSVNTDTVTSGSTKINYQVATPNTSGSITIQWISVLGSTSTPTAQTILGKARIQATTTKTQLGKAAIQKTTTKTQLGLARIQKTITRTQLGLARIQKSVARTQTGLARIQATTTRTQLGKADIRKTVSKTQTGLARVQKSVAQTQLGKADIRKTTSQVQLGLARVQKTIAQTQLGLAKISVGSTTKTQLGLARVQKTTTKTQLGKADIRKTVGQTITGLARIQKTVTKTQLGLARLLKTVTRTQLGQSRIQKVTPRTQLGLARIRATATKTQLGLSRIQKTVTKLQLGLAKISKTITKTQLGQSRIQVSSVRIILGKSSIQVTVTHNQLGMARIAPEAVLGCISISSSPMGQATLSIIPSGATLTESAGHATLSISKPQATLSESSGKATLSIIPC